MSDCAIDSALRAWFDEFAEQGIFTTDDRLIVTTWNRWLERHTGRLASEMIGAQLLDAYPTLVERGLHSRYHDALAGQGHLISQPLHGYLLPMPMAVGDPSLTVMPQRARISPLFHGDRPIGTITVIDDVSDRIASEHALRTQIDAQLAGRSAAERALRAKDDFLANLSHELRTPLSAVLGWTNILRDPQLPPEQVSRGMAVIERNALLQVRLIEDLLDTSRILSGKLRLEMEPVDLQQVVCSVLEVMRPAAEAKQIVISRHLEPESMRVLGDADRLHQVFLNLLSNAVKFTDSGGAVACRMELRSDRAVITITDDGRGISPEFLPFVFDRFQQADGLTSRREAGLGLGLALVKELVALHGGTVEAFSAGTRQGSRFVVDLPTVTATDLIDRHIAEPADRASAAASLEGLHVVILDTDFDVRDFLQAALSQQGILVTLLSTPQEVADLLEARPGQQPPDVVVADVDVAESAGYSLIRQLKLAGRVGRRLMAIGFSSSAARGSRELLKSLGYDDHLTKPLELTAVFAALRRAKRGSRSPAHSGPANDPNPGFDQR